MCVVPLVYSISTLLQGTILENSMDEIVYLDINDQSYCKMISRKKDRATTQCENFRSEGKFLVFPHCVFVIYRNNSDNLAFLIVLNEILLPLPHCEMISCKNSN